MFRGVADDMRIARREIFGPVVVAIPASSRDSRRPCGRTLQRALPGPETRPSAHRLTRRRIRIRFLVIKD
ncbi:MULTISPECIES: hypothetical protein [Amycolatopsis]|uniref:Aldehyde dehydrogenase domain-containing protein n=1 Tax=Amycolatopsis albidoflavus TaxID=102226 RepID=A0ABW5HXF4_9PSEU